MLIWVRRKFDFCINTFRALSFLCVPTANSVIRTDSLVRWSDVDYLHSQFSSLASSWMGELSLAVVVNLQVTHSDACVTNVELRFGVQHIRNCGVVRSEWDLNSVSVAGSRPPIEKIPESG